MTKLWYCDTTRWPDIMIEIDEERSHAESTRPDPSHAKRKAK